MSTSATKAKAIRPVAEAGLVHCPAPGCRSDYSHPVEVRVNSGGVVTTVSGKGTAITQGRPTGRGVTTWLEFQCELGHDFAVIFHFHKGQTEFEIVPRGDTRTIRGAIWRD